MRTARVHLYPPGKLKPEAGRIGNGNGKLNADEDYGFDVAGFLHVRQALSAGEVAACNEAIDAVGRDEGMLAWPAPGDPHRPGAGKRMPG